LCTSFTSGTQPDFSRSSRPEKGCEFEDFETVRRRGLAEETQDLKAEWAGHDERAGAISFSAVAWSSGYGMVSS